MAADEVNEVDLNSPCKPLAVIAGCLVAVLALLYFLLVPIAGRQAVDSACSLNVPAVGDAGGVTWTTELHMGWRPHWTCDYVIGGVARPVDVGWYPN